MLSRSLGAACRRCRSMSHRNADPIEIENGRCPFLFVPILLGSCINYDSLHLKGFVGREETVGGPRQAVMTEWFLGVVRCVNPARWTDEIKKAVGGQ